MLTVVKVTVDYTVIRLIASSIGVQHGVIKGDGRRPPALQVGHP
jgi:hypothetical protein